MSTQQTNEELLEQTIKRLNETLEQVRELRERLHEMQQRIENLETDRKPLNFPPSYPDTPKNNVIRLDNY